MILLNINTIQPSCKCWSAKVDSNLRSLTPTISCIILFWRLPYTTTYKHTTALNIHKLWNNAQYNLITYPASRYRSFRANQYFYNIPTSTVGTWLAVNLPSLIVEMIRQFSNNVYVYRISTQLGVRSEIKKSKNLK